MGNPQGFKSLVLQAVAKVPLIQVNTGIAAPF